MATRFTCGVSLGARGHYVCSGDCQLLARSARMAALTPRPLSGAKRTFRGDGRNDVNDPKLTLSRRRLSVIDGEIGT